MKKILLLVTLLVSVASFGQSLLQDNVSILMPSKQTGLTKKLSTNKSTICGPDSLQYGLNKATGLQSLNINNATSAQAVSQYFDAPQAITISGVTFYAYKIDLTNGATMNATVSVFAAGADSMPTGLPLATASVLVDTTFAPGTLDVLQKDVSFAVPVTTSNPYVVVVSNMTATPMGMVFSSWTAADGAQEWLPGVDLFGTWTRPYNVSIGGAPFDADCLFEPHVTYNLASNFTISDPCFTGGTTQTFTSTSSPVLSHRMYNLATFIAQQDLSHTWDYGDLSPQENGATATHTYAAAGGYAVTLTDTMYGWTTICSSDTTISIGVAPNSAWTSSTNFLTANFTDQSTFNGAVTHLWDFGDGNTSTQQNPSHTYAADGTYTVCLTVSDACGADSSCQSVTVSVACVNPVADYTYVSNNLAVDFTDASATTGSMVTWAWDFGDGNSSSVQNPSHVYAAPGTYTVCLAVVDSCGANTYCEPITVTCPQPTAGFTVSGTDPSFTFTNTSTTSGTVTYAWDFGDGNTSTVMSPSHTYTANGTYTVILVVTDDCGSNTFTGTVTVATIGIEEHGITNVNVYPNPSNGQFLVTSTEEIQGYIVTDLGGKQLAKGSVNALEATVNLADFANGQYVLVVQFTDGFKRSIRVEIMK